MTSRQAGVNKELDNQLRQARLRINELENNISAVKAEIHKEFTKSKSDKEQLQKVIENLSVREMKLFEELMRSKSLINVLRTSFNALMVRHSGELTQPKPADCDCGILTSRIKHLLSSLESIYISYNSYKSLWPLILDLSNKIPEQVAPAAILKMSNFTKMNESKERWYSKPFFAYKGGYKMSLIVDAVGSEKGEGTHVSVYLFLMKGPHDDELQQSGNWPLRGTFTIELLNQLDDYRHRTSKVYISNTTSSSSVTNRIMNGSYAPSGRGISQFISHNDAFLNAYLKNDTLYFRINYQGSSQLSYHLHRNIGWQYIRLLLIAVIIICGTL